MFFRNAFRSVFVKRFGTDSWVIFSMLASTLYPFGAFWGKFRTTFQDTFFNYVFIYFHVTAGIRFLSPTPIQPEFGYRIFAFLSPRIRFSCAMSIQTGVLVSCFSVCESGDKILIPCICSYKIFLMFATPESDPYCFCVFSPRCKVQ